jgi:hypothetical protein
LKCSVWFGASDELVPWLPKASSSMCSWCPLKQPLRSPRDLWPIFFKGIRRREASSAMWKELVAILGTGIRQVHDAFNQYAGCRVADCAWDGRCNGNLRFSAPTMLRRCLGGRRHQEPESKEQTASPTAQHWITLRRVWPSLCSCVLLPATVRSEQAARLRKGRWTFKLIFFSLGSRGPWRDRHRLTYWCSTTTTCSSSSSSFSRHTLGRCWGKREREKDRSECISLWRETNWSKTMKT